MFIKHFAPPRELPDLDAILCSMSGRYSSNLIDKVCSIAFPFQRRGPDVMAKVAFPIYDACLPVSVAWEQLISIMASTDMYFGDLHAMTFQCDDLGPAQHNPTIQLLRLFPHPSQNHWFPSWAQLQQYPDVSVKDDSNDPGLGAGGIDYSLHIMSGRIYRGCSLRLTQPPTPGKKAIYFCTMGDNGAQLVATVPGIELQIDSGSKYVLVDISPDRSLWPHVPWEKCKKTDIGHEHLPIWQESVILICEEVDTLVQPTTDIAGGAESSPEIMRYCLRRVTTLEWNCRLSAKPSPGRWLPFEPSLVHMRSVVCSARAPSFINSISPSMLDVFCDPAAVAGLLSQEEWDGKCDGQWPVYKVYLV